MNNNKIALIGYLRMSIQFIWFTMCGPAGMTHGNIPIDLCLVDHLFEILDSALAFENMWFFIKYCNTG